MCQRSNNQRLKYHNLYFFFSIFVYLLSTLSTDLMYDGISFSVNVLFELNKCARCALWKSSILHFFFHLLSASQNFSTCVVDMEKKQINHDGGTGRDALSVCITYNEWIHISWFKLIIKNEYSKKKKTHAELRQGEFAPCPMLHDNLRKPTMKRLLTVFLVVVK